MHGPRLRCVLAGFLAVAATLGPLPAETARAEDAPPPAADVWTARSPDVARSAAAALWSAAEEAKRAQLFEFAVRTARRTVELDPEHRAARAVLGQSKKDGAWTDDPALAAKAPRTNFPAKFPGAEEAAAIERRWVQSDRSARAKAAAVWSSFGESCAKQGDAAAAERAQRAALALDPDHAKARAALGHYRWRAGVWLTADQVRAAEAAMKAAVVDAASPLDAAFGTKLNKVETPHFRLESRLPPARLQEIASWLEAAYAVHLADLGKDPAAQVFPSVVRMALYTNEAEWNAYVDGFVPRNKDFYRTLEGVWAEGWLYGMKPPADDSDETRRDHLLHRAVHAVDSFALGLFWPSWVDEGLCHLTAIRLQGMTRTWCVAPSTSEYAKLDQPGGRAGWIDESEWKRVTRAAALAKDDLPLRTLVSQKFPELGFPGVLKAWSVLDAWRAEDPESFRALLPKLRAARDPAQVIETHFGKGLEALDDDWRRWVLRTY